MKGQKYPEEPLKCWNKAKELRYKVYASYAKAVEEGGMRIAGCTIAPNAVLKGFGRDVYFLGSEPYCAGAAAFSDFATPLQEACERKGIARDLCGYMKNYWGGILTDKFILPDKTIIPWPKPTLFFSYHICCTHGKWYQYASELEGVPYFAIDLSPRLGATHSTKESMDYMVAQLSEGIEWLEKTTGRKFDEELFIEYAMNEFNSGEAWAEAYIENEAIPAPIDEKALYSFFFFNMTTPEWPEVVDLYREFRDELRDRVKRGIAGCGTERYRIFTDGPPTWAALQIFRFAEREYGAVSIASLYTSHWGAVWERDKEGSLIPAKPPTKGEFSSGNREDRIRKYLDWKLDKTDLWFLFYDTSKKSEYLKKMIKQWKCDGVFMHLNRGCEGTSLGIMETKLALTKAGIPVLSYEGNMGDTRDFDYGRTQARMETFLQNQGLEKLGDGS